MKKNLLASTVLGACVLAAVSAHADGMAASPFLSGPDSFTLKSFLDSDAPLSMYGVTIYGTLDYGITDQSHAAAYNQDFPTSVADIVNKNGVSNSLFVSPSSMEQSKAGAKFDWTVYEDWKLVGKIETAFNPVNLNIPNAQRSIVTQGTQASNNPGTSINGDSSRLGQWNSGASYGGVSNKVFGTLVYGRMDSLLQDFTGVYDPQYRSYAFSPLGFSGKYSAGMGDTENARLDNAFKYNVKYGPVRFAALYQRPGTTYDQGGDQAYQAMLGLDYQDLTMDAFWAKKKMAENAAFNSLTTQPLKMSLSDNQGWGVGAKYNIAPFKLFAGFERYAQMKAGTTVTNLGKSAGGFYDVVTAAGNGDNYSTAQVYNMAWLGTQYTIITDLTASVAYYEWFVENGSGIDNGVCIAKAGKTCAGTQQFASFSLDYKFNKRFDTYAGVMYSRVNDGQYINNGYIHNNDVNTALGLRFKF